MLHCAAGNKRKADVARKDLWGGPGGGDGELMILNVRKGEGVGVRCAALATIYIL